MAVIPNQANFRQVAEQSAGWVASTPSWTSPPFDTPQAALTYAEVEGWPGYEWGYVVTGELVLEYDDAEVQTGKQVGLKAGDNRLQVVVSRTGAVRGVSVGAFHTLLASQAFIISGDQLNLYINLELS